jgi:hypothetical protein
MTTPTIAIFGSCVSRDLFEDARLRPSLSVYGARSSVISAVSPVVAIDGERVVLSSAWQRRCVLADFHKTFFASLADARPDWLVIDLIDERFNLLRCDGSFVTHSSAFEACGLADAPDLELVPVRRMSADGNRLFEHAAEQFAARVVRVLPAERVILHRALWCSDYRADRDISPFPDGRRSLCENQNSMLDHGYDALAEAFCGRSLQIRHDRERSLADAAHRWDLEPYHYDGPTNASRTAQLAEIVGLT